MHALHFILSLFRIKNLVCAATLAGCVLHAQDLGSLAVFVGNANKQDPAADAAFEVRSAEADATLGQGQTLVVGYCDYKQSMGWRWVGTAAWWRTSTAASSAAGHLVPVYNVGLADSVTTDPVAQMWAVGDPDETVYGPMFQEIIDGFRTSGYATLYLRIGWEHNGEWYPWATTNVDKTPNPERTAAFIAAWRRVADLAHQTEGIRVLTVWSPNFERLTPAQVAATYPGDEYVDVIAPDMYSPIWNAIPENWDPEQGGTSNEAEWKNNLVNRQHTWDYPSASVQNPTAGYGLVAMMQFALDHDKPFGLGETGTDGGPSNGIDRGPEDRGDFPLYLAKRIAAKRAEGLRFAFLTVWNSSNYRFSGGARPRDTAGWVTLVNSLAGADPVQVEDIAVVSATDAVTTLADPGATGNYVPDATRPYVREQDISGDISKFSGNAVNDYVEYLVPVPAPGAYNVKVRIKTHHSRGIHQLFIDGASQGEALDSYSLGQEFLIVDFGRKTFATGGDKIFRFVVTGRNTSSSGHTLVVDYFDLTPDRMEVETLNAGAMTAGTTLFHEAAASGGAAERFDADGAGDYIEYTVPVIQPGTYAVSVRVKKHHARGMFQLRIGGAYQGFVQDLYAPYGTPDSYVELDLGTKVFQAAGDKTFRFTVTGRNAASSGYWLALDSITLTPQ